MKYKQNYIYLITDKDRFKIGFTTNPKKRNSEYKVHNLDYKFEGVFKVDDKEAEKSIHMSLLKQGFTRCLSYKEWFEGNLSLKKLEQEIKDYYSRKDYINVL